MPKPPILWNRLEDATSYAKSIIGNNGTVNTGSPTYSAVKFGNGIDAYSTTEAAIPGFLYTHPTKGTMTFSILVKNASTTSGTYWAYPYGNLAWWITMSASNTIRVGWYLAVGLCLYQFPITFSANEVMSIAVVFDASATERIRLFKNGSEISSNAKTYNNSWTAQNLNFFMGGYSASSCVIDNVKIYDYNLSASEILQDMNNERGNINDQVIIS